MNIEQILIKIGVDGTAVKTGLAKVGSTVKAWGQEVSASVKEYMGSVAKGFLGAEAITKGVEFLGEIKNKILEISRVSKETGASTDFVQSMMLEAEKSGISFDRLSAGIARFNHTLGGAKMGEADAVKKLVDIGVVTDIANIKTLTFEKALHNLGVRFDSLNDKQKQAYILSQAFGKGYDAFQPMFNRGVGSVDQMSQGGFFTKIDKSTISDFTTVFRSIKTSSTSIMATVANTLDVPFKAVAKVSYGLGLWSKGIKTSGAQYTDLMNHRLDDEQKYSDTKALQATADKEGISVEELKNKILEDRTELTQKQLELTSEIADRDKESVNEMAERARKATGLKGPLEMFHTVTPRMRTALKIKNLEEQAQVAFLQDNDTKSNQLQAEADQIRKSNSWMKRADVNPMQKTESELAKVILQLDPVKRMAEMVTNTKQ